MLRGAMILFWIVSIFLATELGFILITAGTNFLFGHYWVNIFSLVVVVGLVFLPRAFLVNYGLVVAIFLPLVMLLGRFMNNLDLSARFGETAIYNEKLLTIHVLLMASAYLAFSLNFLSSLSFLRLNILLKAGELKNPLAGRWNVTLLNKLNHRLLLMGIILIALGMLVSLFFIEFNKLITISHWVRIFMPIGLLLVGSWVVMDCYKKGVRGRLLARRSIFVFVLSMASLLYEFVQI
ncbi:MAG: hypothetical protein JJV97_02475 [SAR324 cluster bacterium]|nr:hypothetical protein [SAR324 cluster bacterium]